MHGLLVAMQRVVYERPPPDTLRRGLVALPTAPTVAVVVLLVAALVGVTVYRRLRAR